jgi:hypothetical protein
MQSLVKTLLKIPGLSSGQVSKGLRVPPLHVISVEKPEQTEKLKTMLEKLGAVCEIENTEAPIEFEKFGEKAETAGAFNKNNQMKKMELPNKSTRRIRFSARHRHRFKWNFWLIIFAIMAFFAALTLYSPHSCDANKSKPKQTKTQTARATDGGSAVSTHKKASSNMPAEEDGAKGHASAMPKAVPVAGKTDSELKKDLVKNPYNAAAWKALSENLEKKGDTASARAAKESYEKSVKAQMVLASLAKAFGNKVRVEVTEDAVYYRTSQDLTEDAFHHEAHKLLDSLEIKFPGKNLVIENYTSDNKVQSITLKAKVNNPTQPSENDSPK